MSFWRRKLYKISVKAKDIVIQKSDESNTFVTVDKKDHLDI